MNAREMFKKLGFEQTLNDSDFIFYEKIEAESCHTRFMFALESRSFEAIFYVDGYGGGGHFIELDEFKVILKQMKELGWLEEEQKQETNLERYYDDLLEEGFSDFGVVNGKIESCTFISCKKCEFEGGDCHKNRITWLTSKCKKRKHKFTQFEYDLIDTYRGSNEICKFHNCYQLRRLKEKGYFNDVDKNESIKDILANCEVEG